MNTIAHLRPCLILLFLCCHTAAFAFYNPTTGRWLSRDPIQEKGGVHLYRMARNNLVNLVDSDGRDTWAPHHDADDANSFVDHYGDGNGADFDLLLGGWYGDIQRIFATEISSWRTYAKHRAESEAWILSHQCSNAKGGVLRKHISLRGSGDYVDVTWRGYPSSTWDLAFALGKTKLFRGYEIDIQVVCCYKMFSYSGSLHFGLNDRFEDPLDISEATHGLLHFEPGTPYRMWAAWTEPIVGGGELGFGHGAGPQ